MELLNKTGVPIKTAGDGLSHREVNAINSTVNNAIDAANLDLINYCNINQEVNDYSRVFTLASAIRVVPARRRCSGMNIKFLSTSGQMVEYIFTSTKKELSEEDWLDLNNWSLPFIEIDGGEWSISD